MDSINVRRLFSIVRFSSITNTISIILPSRDLALVGVLGKAHYIVMMVLQRPSQIPNHNPSPNHSPNLARAKIILPKV